MHQGAFPRLSSSLTLNWSLNVFDYFSTPGFAFSFPRLSSSLRLNWSLNVFDISHSWVAFFIPTFKLQFKCSTFHPPGSISTFKLQFNLKLELKRVRPNFSSRVAFFISTFKLQFNLKLKLKRVRHFTLRVCFLPFPRLSFSLTLN